MWVANCTAPTIANPVESVLKLYHWAGLQVTEVCADHEFKPVLHVLQDCGWYFTTNLASAQEHVPEAKCDNKTQSILPFLINSCYLFKHLMDFLDSWIFKVVLHKIFNKICRLIYNV